MDNFLHLGESCGGAYPIEYEPTQNLSQSSTFFRQVLQLRGGFGDRLDVPRRPRLQPARTVLRLSRKC